MLTLGFRHRCHNFLYTLIMMVMMMMIVEADRNARNIDVDVGIPAQVLQQSVLGALHFAADMIMMLSLNQVGEYAYRS